MTESENQIFMDQNEQRPVIEDASNSANPTQVENSKERPEELMVKWRKAMKTAYKAQVLLQEVMEKMAQQIRHDRNNRKDRNCTKEHHKGKDNQRSKKSSRWDVVEMPSSLSSSSSSSSSDSEIEIISWHERPTEVSRHHGRRHHHNRRDRSHSRGHDCHRDRSRSRGHSRGRSRGHSRGHSRGRSRGHSRGYSATRDFGAKQERRSSTHTIETNLPEALTL